MPKNANFLLGIKAVAIACSSCGRLGFDYQTVSSDAETDAGTDAGTHVIGETREILQGSSVDREDDPSMTSCMLEMFFNRGQSIYVSRRTSKFAAWGDPSEVPQLKNMFNDGNPEVSRNGKEIYFSSNRTPPNLGIQDVWRATREETACETCVANGTCDDWTIPEHVVTLSTTAFDSVSAPDLSGLRRILASRIGTGITHLFEYTSADAGSTWTLARTLDNLDSVNGESSFHLGPQGLTLYFEGDLNNQGHADVYVAKRSSTANAFDAAQLYTNPVLIDPVNTPGGRGRFVDFGRWQLFGVWSR